MKLLIAHVDGERYRIYLDTGETPVTDEYVRVEIHDVVGHLLLALEERGDLSMATVERMCENASGHRSRLT
ncbi:MAG: hypothetical protein ACLQDV_23085 [Candidatus Binataceae bacterium]